MANTQSSGAWHKRATIDTAPAAAGYWTDPVSMSQENVNSLFLSRSGGGVGDITVQFMRPAVDSSWTDYLTDEDLGDGCRLKIEDSAPGIAWRAGVKNAAYTSGDVVVELSWGKS